MASRWLQRVVRVAGACCLALLMGVMTRGAAGQTSGACCLPSGQCVFYNAVCECDVQGGQFFLGQPCSNVNCNVAVTNFGACCLVPSGCVYTNAGTCVLAGGNFLQGQPCNVAATCASASILGCCCGTSCYLTDPLYCNRVGGIPQTTACTPNSCNPAPLGACCTSSGACTQTTQTACPIPPNQSWTAGSTCVPGTCLPPGAGACCGPNGCQIIMNPCECLAKLGGPFLPGQSCNPNPCPTASPLGSCCIPSTVPGQFTCTTTSQTTCSQLNGIFTGNGGCNVAGGSCVPQAAACCCPITNTCHWLAPQVCALLGGISGPIGQACTPLTCAPAGSGACCNPATGGCAIVASASACPAPGVFYPGVTCQNIACNPSFGACCNTATGACFVGPTTQCAGPGFIWIAGANCVPNPCPLTGACCTPCTGACTVVPQSQCPTTGTWFGNQACAPGLCPQAPLFGACCLNGNCVQATSCDCIFKLGTFLGPNGVCNPSICATQQSGACCIISTSMCSVLSGPTCNQIGGVFTPGQPCVGAGANCQGVPPQPAPACCCCGSCKDLLPQACALAGGVSNAGSSCQNFSCNPNSGACCDPLTGICTNVASVTACPAPSQFFLNQTCVQIQAQGLCPQPPPGLCCDLTTGTCFATAQSACTGPQYLWIPSGVCTPATCPHTGGACCDPLVGCYPVGNPTQCTGQFIGVGVPCVPSPCNLVCCDPATGACQSITAVGCPTGWVQLPGPTCTPQNPCPPVGACCIPGTILCQITTQANCNGVWVGANTACQPNPCVGACCDPNTGLCTTVFATLICPNGLAAIPGVTCTPNPCPIVCCNQTTGACTVVTGAACPTGSVQLSTATSCQPNPCPPVGPCCLSTNGNCVITTLANCSGGIWGPAGGSCVPSPCRGACCNPLTGACVVTTQGNCLAQGFLFLGINTACVGNPCPPPPIVICCNPATGACSVITGQLCPPPLVAAPVGATSCNPNPCPPVGPCCTQTAAGFTCTITLQAACNGVWGPAGGTCTTNPCVGACCNPNTGACSSTTQQACVNAGGQWLGLNSSCVPNPCPPVGPCCLTTNQCIITTQSGCTGIWGPAGGSCVPNPCKGACCNLLTGSCFISNLANCPAPLFAFSPGVSCSPNPCPGACCNPFTGQCSIVPASQCATPNIFLGNGVSCPPAPCVVGTCCFQNGQCLVIAVQTCLQQGGFWLGNVPCTPTTCRGACCTTAGCVITNPLNCPAGSWQGPSTFCSPNPCPGACCTKTGGCYITVQANCQGNQVFQGAGTTCSPNNPCLGACCRPPIYGGLGSVCIQTTQLQCISLLGGGQWQGLGVPCQSPPGNYTACCRANINGQNGVTIQDLFTFLQCWFAQLPCGNFNGVGGVTLQDLFDFLAAWFAGCS